MSLTFFNELSTRHNYRKQLRGGGLVMVWWYKWIVNVVWNIKIKLRKISNYPYLNHLTQNNTILATHNILLISVWITFIELCLWRNGFIFGSALWCIWFISQVKQSESATPIHVKRLNPSWSNTLDPFYPTRIDSLP